MDPNSIGIVITSSMTTPSKPGKKPRPVWEVAAPSGYERLMYDLGAKRWRGRFSFWEDPTASITEALDTYKPESYEERVEGKNDRSLARVERLEAAAERREQQAEASFKRAHDISDTIPFGQPILVGHHSEGRHRRDLARIDAAGFKGVALMKDKADFEYRARGAEARVERQESIPFCQRRINDAETELRSIDRKLKGEGMLSGGAPEPGSVYHTRLMRWKEEQEEKRAYWQAKFEALGGLQFNKDEVRAGALLRRENRPGTVYRIIRVNRKTVTVRQEGGASDGWEWKVPYAELGVKYLALESKEPAQAQDPPVA